MGDPIPLSIKNALCNDGDETSQLSPPPTTSSSLTTTTTPTNMSCDNMDNSNTHSSTNNTFEKTEGSCLQDEKMSQYGGIENTSCLDAGQQRSTAVVSDGDGNGGGVDNLSFDPSPETKGSTQNPPPYTANTKPAPPYKESKSLVPPGVGIGVQKEKAVEVEKGIDKSGNQKDGVPCGIGVCQPQCLQRFRSIGCFSLLYGLSGIMTSALASYISSQITTLERHFNFNSSVSGFLMSCNDLGFFITCLFLSYLTRRIHIPRFLALATVLYGLSGLMCTIPFFGTKSVIEAEGAGLSNRNVTAANAPGQMCIRESRFNNSCDDASKKSDSGGGIHGVSENWRNLAITFIGIGMVIQGIAKSPRSSFVSVYIDDNVPKTKSTFYLGIIAGMSILGPSLAFILGGVFSSVYITLEDTNMSNKDPRWLGAWWLGFLIFGSVSLVVGIPLLFFPRKIMIKPEIELVEKKRKMKGEGKNKVVVEAKGFSKAVFKLLVNPLYVLLVLAAGVNSMSVSGLVSFGPKYMEAHFNMSTWLVNIVLGAMTVGGASLGTVIGGMVTSKLRLAPVTCLKMKIGVTLLAVCVQTAGLFVKCDQPVFNKGNSGLIGNVSQCTSSCGCNDISFYPVCGDDNKNYFSPCHAGCTDVVDGGKIFSNCSCLSSPQFSAAKGGLCDSGCSSMFWLYSCLGFITSVAYCITIMPSFITLVRSVSEDQKPMALGISSFTTTLIGWFPGPILFGVIVDTTCLITQSSPCEKSSSSNGACLSYDLELFRYRYLGTAAALRFAAICLYICAYLYVKCSSKPTFYAHEEKKGDGIDDAKEKDGKSDDKNKK